MTRFFLWVMAVAFLAASAQGQEATPPDAPSVADAARAARERQKSITPKRVMTDDEIAPKDGRADGGVSAADVRAEMEKHYPARLNLADLRSQTANVESVAAKGDAGMLESVNRSALYRVETVEFPGKKQWEEDAAAVSHMVQEAGKAAARLQQIINENEDVILGGDPLASARAREMWIDALLPYDLAETRSECGGGRKSSSDGVRNGEYGGCERISPRNREQDRIRRWINDGIGAQPGGSIQGRSWAIHVRYALIAKQMTCEFGAPRARIGCRQ